MTQDMMIPICHHLRAAAFTAGLTDIAEVDELEKPEWRLSWLLGYKAAKGRDWHRRQAALTQRPKRCKG